MVFVLSVVKVALAMDEAEMFSKISIGMELMPSSIDSFSKQGNVLVSASATVAISLVFVVLLYFFGAGVKDSVFGFIYKKSID